jgi:hypothetical protein
MSIFPRVRIAGFLALACLTGLAASPVAQAAPASHMATTKSVYVCKMCKSYFSPAAAMKMGYKDSMGHKLVKVSKVPAGYMNGSKSKMSSPKM